jgi:NAD(P)H-dependent flavin oxidoreductase YrpB (nitropropane dioxygenase family)
VNSVLHTRICDLFGVKYPVVQTGMGWVSGPRLTAATSAAGGFGILASATLTYAELEAGIAEIRALTDKPFGVNLRTDQDDVERRIDLLIRERIKVASFAQAPTAKAVERLKAGGVLTMPTIGARRHAEKVAKMGVDAVIAQGAEGGGHTGEVPTALLVGEVCRAVDLPVLAAGGFHDGRGLVAALAYGASGIAMGTRFLLTQESSVPEAVKATYLKTQVTGTVVSRKIDGYPQRVIRTDLVDRLESAGPVRGLWRALQNGIRFQAITQAPILGLLREAAAMRKRLGLAWAQVIMAANAPILTRASMVDGNLEVGILPTGQVVGVIEELPTVEVLLQRIIAEAEVTLGRLQGGRP